MKINPQKSIDRVQRPQDQDVIYDPTTEFLPSEPIEARLRDHFAWHSPDDVLWEFVKPDLRKIGEKGSGTGEKMLASVMDQWKEANKGQASESMTKALQVLEETTQNKRILAIYRHLLLQA